jgi:hypothetical protein
VGVAGFAASGLTLPAQVGGGALQGMAAVQSERNETEGVDGEEDKSKGLFLHIRMTTEGVWT